MLEAAMITAREPACHALPALTVVLVTGGSFDTVRKVVRCLRAQTICERVELLIIVRSQAAFAADLNALSGFGRLEIIEIGEFSRVADAKAIAVTRATAPVVAFAEDHCFPDPNWGEALLAAHGADWAGVGPAVLNANPATAISRTGFLMHWAPWMHPAAAGPAPVIAWHNSSYRRSALLDLAADLPRLLAVENFLHAELRQRGHRLYVEPTARVSHTNISRGLPWLLHNFWGGRLYAARRVRQERWTWLERGRNAAGLPLIPLTRLWRLIALLRRAGRLTELSSPRTLGLLVVGLIIHAAGEVVGYILGEGDAETHYTAFEMHRFRDLAPRDQPVMTE
jgi:hypothetical protein